MNDKKIVDHGVCVEEDDSTCFTIFFVPTFPKFLLMTFTVFGFMMLFFLGGELATLVNGAFVLEMFTTPLFFVEAGAEEEIDTDFFVLEKRSNPPIPFA